MIGKIAWAGMSRKYYSTMTVFSIPLPTFEFILWQRTCGGTDLRGSFVCPVRSELLFEMPVRRNPDPSKNDRFIRQYPSGSNAITYLSNY